MTMVRIGLASVILAASAVVSLLASCRAPDRGIATRPGPSPVLTKLRSEAAAVRPLVTTQVAREFLSATEWLPAAAPRVLLRTADKTRYYSETEAAGLPEGERAALQRFNASEEFYYTTKYGTPLAYVRPVELLGLAGMTGFQGRKVLDFGYGTVGHLRLFALQGADATGVDVDPMLTALYSMPGDQGPVVGANGRRGSVKLVGGRFPAEQDAMAAVGEGFDLILSKNTLKNGYLHPAEPVDKRMLVDLGISDEEFVRTLFRILKPGGRVMIYNICPAPSAHGTPYKPWADGRCPFPRNMLEAAGFRVLAYDVQDDDGVRAMAHAFGWDSGEDAMDLHNDLFAWYTVAEKPGR